MNDLHIDAVRALPPDQPVVMLNLMRFRERSLDGDGTGWDAYVRYSVQANQLIKERGGRIMWAGPVNGVALGPTEHGQWDYTALVTYPTPGAFLDMMASEAYAVANVHRENGCAAHLIMTTDEAWNGWTSPR